MAQLSHAEVQELLGAYALHAVEGDEREAVERHLETCGPCRAEVAEHREVAGLLASGWSPAPEGVWDRIASSLEEAPPPMSPPVSPPMSPSEPRALWPPVQPPAVVPLDRERRRRRRLGVAGRVAAAVAVAASLAVVGLVGQEVINTGDQVDDVASALREGGVGPLAEAAAGRPDARRVTLSSADGRLSAQAVVLADGSGYLLETDLPQLPPDRTYQLWAVVGSSKISVGVLGPDPGPAAFHTNGSVAALAITEEVAGGVVVSEQEPTVVGTVA